jgi:glycosyltransferase involved in cell wall biosynthesis
MTSPKISVLIPTYNYGRYLEEAIESVLVQDFEDYELIVSDDCSSDNSEEIMARYEGNSRVRYHRHTSNLGMVENWNWCLSEARGEFVKYVFGDDKLSRTDSLGKLLSLMEDNPSVALGACARLIINQESVVLTTWNNLGKSGRYNGEDIINKCLTENRNIIGEPSVAIFRREIAGAGFNLRYRQLVDLEFWFKLLEKGDLMFSDEPLCCFRKHSLQETEKNRSNGVAEVESIRIFLDYHDKILKYNSQWWKFIKIYGIKKLLKKNGGISPEMRLLEKELSIGVSKTRYCINLIRYKLTNPIKKMFEMLLRFGKLSR